MTGIATEVQHDTNAQSASSWRNSPGIFGRHHGDTSRSQAGRRSCALSRLVTGSPGVSADMAYRLGEAFGTSPELWAGMQLQYDLYQAGKLKRPRIDRLAA